MKEDESIREGVWETPKISGFAHFAFELPPSRKKESKKVHSVRT